MGTTGTPPAGDTCDTARRLRTAAALTGLTAAQLGVARLYARPHPGKPVTGTGEAGPLQGVEILVKDLQRVAGETTGFGSPAHAAVATADDATVRRLLSTGASIVGASVTAEFGATVYTEPVDGPGPVNPVDPRMTSGGSSSGAAVAVARGIVDIAHASDGGGSIRVPAAAVGLPGLKPAHRVFDNGALPDPAAQGFIAADLDLTAHAYGVEREAPDRDGRSGIRLGMSTVAFHGDPGQSGPTAVDPRIAAATTAAAALLVTCPQVTGVTPVDAPYPVDRFAVFSRIMAARCAALPEPLGPMPGWLKARGAGLTASDLSDAVASLRALPADIIRVWADVDVVVTPTLACAPPPVGAFSALSEAGAHRLDFLAQTAWTPWATLWNLTGWAGLSVPLVDPSPGHWPVSVHLGAVGDRASAATLLALGTCLRDAVARLVEGDAAARDAFTLSEPGDIESLGYRPVSPGHGHSHGHSHGDSHGDGHGH